MPSASRLTMVTAIVLALVIPVLIVTALLVEGYIGRSFELDRQVRETRRDASYSLRLQLDEETGVRAYSSTHEALFLEPYRAAVRKIGPALQVMETSGVRLRLAQVAAAAADMRRINETWRRTVAEPLMLKHPRNPDALQRRGKLLIDRFRLDEAGADAALTAEEMRVTSQTTTAIDRVIVVVLGAVLLALVVSAAFLRSQQMLSDRVHADELRAERHERQAAELRAQFAAEKRIADTLAEAMAQHSLPCVQNLGLSAVYVPAVETSRIGGDWYDVLELPRGRVLFAIGDVAGHGIEAAVMMSRSRQALIRAALLNPDPGSMLGRVNAELLQQPATMVTALCCYADAATYEFAYASAGHPPPLLIEPNERPRVLDPGSLPLGIAAQTQYRTNRLRTVAGATVVLYTDGLIEHTRDVIEGEELLVEAAQRVAKRGVTDMASEIHRAIFGGKPALDDAAILTISFAPGSANATVSARSAQLGVERVLPEVPRRR